jgi:hypothetical protein
MRPLARVGVVLGGYVAAVLAASGVTALYVAATAGLDRQTSSGMYAFGDSLLFLAVFGVAALVPTGAGLWFLRPSRRFWAAYRAAALTVAATAVAAALIDLAGHAAPSGTALSMWAGFSMLRIFLSPLCALVFALSALLAPHHRARVALFVAAGFEAAAFASLLLRWALQPGP